jgi:hypothetical protein
MYLVFRSYGVLGNSYSDWYSCSRDARTGEVMHAAALGTMTAYDTLGYSSYWYLTVSSMADITVTPLPSPSAFPVYTGAVRMIIPSSLVTGSTSVDATASITHSPSGTSTKAASKLPNYHVAGQSFPISIVITVVFGMAALLFLCCIPRIWKTLKRCIFPRYPPCAHSRWMTCIARRKGKCCLCMRPSSRGYSLIDNNLADFCSPCQSTWYAQPQNFPPGCNHKVAWSCGKERSTVCCACSDRNFDKLPFESRMAGYCFKCRSMWQSDHSPQFPSYWLPFPGCGHPTVSGCAKGSRGKCCCCQDTGHAQLSLQDRVCSYCATCRQYWTRTTPKPTYPTHWLPFPCSHSKSCGRTRYGRCCQCNDTRGEKLTIETRTRPFCSSCQTRVILLYTSGQVGSLPAIWQPFPQACAHIKTRGCARADLGKCCNCTDATRKTSWNTISWSKSEFCKACIGDQTWTVILLSKEKDDKPAPLVVTKPDPLPAGMEDRGPQPSMPSLMSAGDLMVWRVGKPIPKKSGALSILGGPPPSTPVATSTQSTANEPQKHSTARNSRRLSRKPVPPAGKKPTDQQRPVSGPLGRKKLPAEARLSSLADFHKLEMLTL